MGGVLNFECDIRRSFELEVSGGQWSAQHSSLLGVLEEVLDLTSILHMVRMEYPINVQ